MGDLDGKRNTHSSNLLTIGEEWSSSNVSIEPDEPAASCAPAGGQE